MSALRKRSRGIVLSGLNRLTGRNMSDLGLVYYGYVFDASGYGHAARAYIHALHGAGVELSVVDLANNGKQVRDELVESLVGRRVAEDYHLFHGIPPQWAGRAFRLSNAIGMTVWETDVMPTQWRNSLNHVLEVWLPCDFNVTAFRPALDTRIFKLPHPLLPRHTNGDVPEPDEFLGISEGDFVFYSIFEWQDRKSPDKLIESFMRAFKTEGDAVLIIKTNPAAATAAREAVQSSREITGSAARVFVRCEGWNEAEIESLQLRGDCYVSLHRGEGWGYPLFEAAARGTPVIATNYSGPLEYLDPARHCLVACELGPVRQPYVYYHPGMRWAQPDSRQAADLMRWVFCNREEARHKAEEAAARIGQSYSLQAVGSLGKQALIDLFERTQPAKWRRLGRIERVKQLAPPSPVPPEWYDQDYFEKGLKSNWDNGYSWDLFSGVFKETARFLSEMFPEADSFLDIGCAKGLLVRALIEEGKHCSGIDHSKWALEHSDETAKPFLIQAGVDDACFSRQFDVLVAFSIFESLTESQALSLLSRARMWTENAIMATISTVKVERESHAGPEGDGDLSHITMRSREWWHELFLRAGWKQDPVHKIAERVCQSHALPAKMGWNVYLYVPSSCGAVSRQGGPNMMPKYFAGSRSELETVSRQNCQTARLSDEVVLCRVLGRYIVYSDPQDVGITPHLCLDGFWESWITVAMARILRPGWRCVDVGANHGYYTLIMADAAGPDGLAVAVEPNPALSEMIKLSLEVNGFKDRSAVVQKAAYSADARRMNLVVPRNRSMDATLHRSPTEADDAVEVETTTVDEITREWPRVDFIKIDAEGAEEFIWRGMESTLERNHNLLIIMEMRCERYSDPRGFLRLIQANGFRLRHIDYDSTIQELTEDEALTERLNEDWMLYLSRTDR
jgi:FkbM family methyltransferase